MVLTVRDGEAIEFDDGHGGRALIRLDAVRADGGFFRAGEANVIVELPLNSRIKARVVQPGPFSRSDSDERLFEMFKGLPR